MDSLERKIITLLSNEIEEILDGDSREFTMVETNFEAGDNYNLIIKNKQDEYFKTSYNENSLDGIYYQQSYAEQVFPKERKVTIVVYE